MSVAFVFPGQGAQVVGMGRDLVSESAAARAIYAEADATLGWGLSQLCFDGPAERLMATENAQPAILATSIALLAVLAEAHDATLVEFVAAHAQFVAGHSLGEYSAIVASGALDFASALRLVRRRGELMAEAADGAMAAIIGLDDTLEALCREVSAPGAPVVIANYNAPDQLVISGATAAVEQVIALAKARGARRALPLKVSAAFHSPLMQVAGAGLAEALDAATIRDALTPVVANVTATPITTAADIRAELRAQVTASVRWIASVEQMAAAGVDTFVEIGPGAVLTGLIKRIAPAARLLNVNDLASARTVALH